jgi:hypothetical protein
MRCRGSATAMSATATIHPEQLAEGVVAGQTVLQLEKAAQKRLFRFSKSRYGNGDLSTVQHRAERDHHQLVEVYSPALAVRGSSRPSQQAMNGSKPSFRATCLPRQKVDSIAPEPSSPHRGKETPSTNPLMISLVFDTRAALQRGLSILICSRLRYGARTARIAALRGHMPARSTALAQFTIGFRIGGSSKWERLFPPV